MGLVRAHTHTQKHTHSKVHIHFLHSLSRPQVLTVWQIYTHLPFLLYTCARSQPRENNSRQENNSYINNILNLQGAAVSLSQPPNIPTEGTI